MRILRYFVALRAGVQQALEFLLKASKGDPSLARGIGNVWFQPEYGQQHMAILIQTSICHIIYLRVAPPIPPVSNM